MGGGGGGGRGFDPRPDARWVLSVECDGQRQKSWSPRSVSVWQQIKLSDISLGTRPQDSLVADEDFDLKNPLTNQPNSVVTLVK